MMYSPFDLQKKIKPSNLPMPKVLAATKAVFATGDASQKVVIMAVGGESLLAVNIANRINSSMPINGLTPLIVSAIQVSRPHILQPQALVLGVVINRILLKLT